MLGRLVIRPYAAHSSVWTTVLGSVCYWIMLCNVARYLDCTISMYPLAGEVDTSTIPNTHI